MNVMKIENEQVERVQRETQQSPSDPKRELLSSIGLFIGTTGLLGFWFEVGAALGAKMVNSLEELISVK